MNSMPALNLQRPTLQGVCFVVPETHVCVSVCMCVIRPSQKIPDGGGRAERKTVINVSLVSASVCLLTCVYPKQRATDGDGDPF